MRALHRHVAVAVLVSVVWRLRFVFAPLGDREGVLLAVGRSWSRGGALYRGVWIDRPQGAVVLARAWLAVASPSTFRWVAVAAGALLVVATAGLARSVASAMGARRPDLAPDRDRVAAVTAMVVAAWSSTPMVGGPAAGPVLVGAVFVTAALWSSAAAVGGTGGWSALGAGLCCGVAVSLDLYTGIAAMSVPIWLAVAAARRGRRDVAVSTLRLVAVGAVAIVAPLIVHASTVGWSTWWGAVVTARMARADPQQWVLAIVPGSVLVGLVVGRVRLAQWCAAMVVASLVPAAWSLGAQVFRTDDRVSTWSGGNGARHAESVGAWLASNTAADDTVLAVCSGAATYVFADRDPAVPFLTRDDLRSGSTSPTLLVSALSGDDRADVVVLFDLPAECGSPSLVGVIAEHYVEVVVVDGVRVLRASGA